MALRIKNFTVDNIDKNRFIKFVNESYCKS